jgi:hypothetical protein
MSCSHLNTKTIDPATHFGNTLFCMDCKTEFRRVAPDLTARPPLEGPAMKTQLLDIAARLREGIPTDTPRQRMAYVARRLEALAEQLTVQWPQSNPWAAAIDEALIVHCLDCTTPDTDPRKALAELIAWAVGDGSRCAADSPGRRRSM